MVSKKRVKRIFNLFLMICLIYSSFGSVITTVWSAEADPVDSAALSQNQFKDVEGHWAEQSLKKWTSSGLIQGYSDGTFRPDRTVNRGEIIALINRSFGFSEQSPILFSDLSVSDWEYEDVGKAVKVGYVEGYADGTIGAKQPVSRQEAAVIITRLLGLEVTEEGSAANVFTDTKQIPQWSRGAIAAVALAKLMEGYEDGSFKPVNAITRAEVVVILERALQSKTAFEYKKAGTYGPDEGIQTIHNNVVVSASGVTLQNMKITGNLLLAEGIKEGDVFLQNVTVVGTTSVNGGGMNSIHVENSVLGKVIVNKPVGTVRIVLKDEGTIAELIVETPVNLEQLNVADTAGIKLLKLSKELPKGSKITLIGGYIDDVLVAAKGIVIEFSKGVIKNLTVTEGATDTSITVGKDAHILSLILDAIIKVLGQGKIDKVNLSEKAKGTTFEKQPLLLEGPGVVYQGGWVGTGGGGGQENSGDDDDYIVFVSAENGSISVTMNTYEAPTNADFVVGQIINNNAPIAVAATLAAWDSATKTATLTVPIVSEGEIDQSVVYRVSYKNGTAIESEAFIVPGEEIVEVVEIVSVSAVNGSISVTMSAHEAPTSADFMVEQIINSNAPTVVAATLAAWDSTTKTATLTVPIVSEGEIDQSVVYRVSYKNGTAIESEAFIVPDEEIVEVIEIVSVSAENGSISVSMSTYEAPTSADFTVEQMINDNAPIALAANLTAWDSATKTATLTVPTVSEGEIEQSVVYRVSYKQAAAVEAAAFIVPAEPVVGPNKIKVVENGVARAQIIVAADASQQIRKAADTLKAYVKKSTGAELEIKTMEQLVGIEPSNMEYTNIFIGVSQAEDEANHQTLLQDMYSDGFIIDAQENNTITIIGPTPWGTEFGVYAFLERYVGVIWLMPGLDGEDVPQQQTIAISPETAVEKPATISRHFFGTEAELGLLNNAEWARRNRMHDNLKFHHNMNTLFDPKVFTDHPEYYPGGVVPTHAYEWQPCFNDQTAEAAIQRIMDYFEEHPDEMSYSLGINDSKIFCETDPNHPDYPGKMNSVGAVDMSDIYYPWVNKVVEGVLENEKYKDKYFGLLAYWNVFDPPTTVKLNSHVVPYITDDRMSWSDPSMEEAGKQHAENWNEAATNLGFYEYFFGSLYNLPRVYMHKMDEVYKYAQELGVIGHVAELFPNFGEGPKPWVSAKLQWNPNLDTDELLNEWYERAVGTEAAPFLAQYYSQWEEFWTTRILDTKWFKTWANSAPRSNFMIFYDYSYFEAVTAEDMAASRLLLEEVVAKAQTVEQKKRAALLLRTFEYYEASALSYPRVEDTAIPSNEQEALKMLDFIKESRVMAKKRVELRNQFKGDPILEISDYLGYGVWDGVQVKYISILKKYVETEPANGMVGILLNELIAEIGLVDFSATAVKTTASKTEILNSLDFSMGPWVEAAPFSDFLVINSKKEPPTETKVYLLWDDDNLYVGYENFDSDMSKMVVSEDTTNGWWRSGGDDANETFVTGDPKGAFTGFMTNPNAINLIYQKQPLAGPVNDPNTVWESSTRIENDRWNLIQVIPFSDIGVDPNVTKTLMGLFFRNYHGHQVYLGWGGGAPWRAEHFNPIYLVDAKNLVQNPSFESGNETQFSSWMQWVVDPSIQTIERTSTVARTGDHSIVHTGVDAGGGPFQDITLTPGRYKEVLYYYVPLESSAEGKIEIINYVMDPDWGTNIGGSISPPAEFGLIKGRWEKFEHIFEIKPEYNGIISRNLRMAISISGLKPGEQLYIDDVALYKLENLNSYVSNEAELKAAVADSTIPLIVITEDITLTETLQINRDVNVEGNNKTIKGHTSSGTGGSTNGIEIVNAAVNISNLKIQGSLGYAIQYRTASGTLKNVSVEGANKGGLLINGSEVTADAITTINNAWGGIEVSRGSGVTNKSELTVKGRSTHSENVAIWTSGTETAVIDMENQYEATADPNHPGDASYRLVENLVKNSSFESGNEVQFSSWLQWVVDPSIQTIERTSAIARTGGYSILNTGVDNGGGPFQDITLTPGMYKEVFYYYVPLESSAEGKIEIINYVMDADWGVNIGGSIAPPAEITSNKGRWEKFEHTFEIPAYNGAMSQNLRLAFTIWGFKPGEQIYIDDVALYKLSN
ncbi:DUF4838 domain-containing protein [Paenibacillus eucommiae]|uniref:SLH domain-containing protein n=1 Tax=Paenibacillus eucommiae TaxID=1355755 RepID=A0ABS4J1X5_9BACL|nr:DUF4838 domain-containing protein [Paenibacillus eucommiae]MBP1993822.1 hypothetical protein [Paenibacillus eucommiae]